MPAKKKPSSSKATPAPKSSKNGQAAAKKEHKASKLTAIDQYTSHYPGWAKEFARKYFTKTVTEFIIYGNVRDFVPSVDEKGDKDYIPLREFLVEDLFSARDIILFYDRSGGIHFADQASQADFNRALSGYDTIFGTDYVQKLPKDPVRVFSVLENYFRLRLDEGKRIAVIIDYAETVVPMAEASMYSSEDRNALVFLQKWSHDPSFIEHDFTICMLNKRGVVGPFLQEDKRIPIFRRIH